MEAEPNTMDQMAKSAAPAVLVTGAGGCTGSRVVELLLELGYRVIAAELPGVAIPEGPPEQLIIRLGDLTDRDYTRRLPEGASAVIHTAALNDSSRTWIELSSVNLEAVINLYEGALAAGAAKFIHFSAGFVLQPKDRALTEKDAAASLLPLGRSKLLAEDYLLAHASAGPVINILRPSLIFGPNGKNFLNLFTAIPSITGMFSRKTPRLIGGPRVNPVHRDDAARAAVHLLNSDQPNGEVFNIAGLEAVTLADIVNILLDEAQFAQLPLNIPVLTVPWLAQLWQGQPQLAALSRMAGFLWCMARRGRKRGYPFVVRLDRQLIDYFARDRILSVTKLTETGFQFSHPEFAPSWRAAYRWFNQAGWLPK